MVLQAGRSRFSLHPPGKLRNGANMKAVATWSTRTWAEPSSDSAPDDLLPLENHRRSAWARAGLLFAIWTLLGLFDASHSIIRYASAGDPVPWYNVLAMCLTLWYCWAFLAIFVFRLARRFPFEGRAWPRHLAVNVVAC